MRLRPTQTCALRTILLLLTVCSLSFSQRNDASVLKEQVLAAMTRATEFMMDTVSTRGGFLWHYSNDLSRRWGEVPARESHVWVQPPSTTTVGSMLVDAFQVTRDRHYVEYADRVAGVLIWGQLPSGGWHYFIDFDPAGVGAWNSDVDRKFRGWEEFYHYYGNGTFDDDTTASAVRFLLRLYYATLDAKYREPLLKGLRFILGSQYPNGAWPQRSPLTREFTHDGRPDYTSFYTFNDGVIANNIYLLLEAYDKLGNEEYRAAARRGMDFYLISQMPEPQAGWAQQYDNEMRPAWARTYEPAALCSGQTVENIRDLENFYGLTGDRRYLRPIPSAIDWLKKSAIASLGDNGTHALFYEVGSNKALYAHHHVEDGKIVRYSVNNEPSIIRSHSAVIKVDTEELERGYRAAAARTPKDAMAAYREQERKRSALSRQVSEAQARELVQSLDERGAWVADIEFIDTDNYVDNPPLRFRGVDTRTYVANMYRCLAFLRSAGGR